MSFKTGLASLCRPFHVWRKVSTIGGVAMAGLGVAQFATIHGLAQHSIEPVGTARVVITGLVTLLGVMTAVAANVLREQKAVEVLPVQDFKGLRDHIDATDGLTLKEQLPRIVAWLEQEKVPTVAGAVRGMRKTDASVMQANLRETVGHALITGGYTDQYAAFTVKDHPRRQ